MKRSFACFLSLAVCLSGCTPAASEPAGEAPATAETAPAEETVETAAFPVGSLVGNRDDAPLPGKMYRIWQSEDSPQSLLELDCETGQERCLYTFEAEPPVTLGGVMQVQPDLIRQVLGQTLYTIPLDGGAVQTLPLAEPFEPMACDVYGAYEFWGGDWNAGKHFRRLDYATGQITELKTPDQVQQHWAVGQDRIILWRLVTDAPLPSIHNQNQQYYAAVQSAISEYDWYDPATGELEKIYAEPYYGVEQADGTHRERYFLGMAGARLYFQNTHQLRGDPGVEVLDIQVDSCAADGTDWQTECTLPEEADSPDTLWEGSSLRWLIDDTTGQMRIYDLQDHTWHTVGPAAWNSTFPEALPGNGKVYLARAKEDGNLTHGLADLEDYLAGSTDWTPVETWPEEQYTG